MLNKLQKTIVFLILLAITLSFSLNFAKAEPLERVTPVPTLTLITASPTATASGVPGVSSTSPGVGSSATGSTTATGGSAAGKEDKTSMCKKEPYLITIFTRGIDAAFDKPFQDMLCNIYVFIVNTMVKVVEFTQDVMVGIAPTSFEKNIENIKEIWKIILSLVDYFLVFALIVIAFINILGLKIDTYAVKKTLPVLILAVVMANFSFLFSRVLAEAASVLTDWQTALAVQATDGKQGKDLFVIFYREIFYGFLQIKELDAGTLAGAIIGITIASGAWIVALIALIIILTIPIILMIIIFLLLMVRNYVLYFLVIASPLAFVALGFPMTQKYFQQWWSQFARWLFMAPLAFAMITLGILVGSKFGDVTKITAGKVVEGISDAGLLPKYILLCLSAYFAIKLPFSLGGPTMGAWGGALKKSGMGLAKHGWNYGNDRLYEFTSRGGRMGWNLRDTPAGWMEKSKMHTESIKAAAKGGGANLKEAGSEFIPRLATGKPFKESIKAFREGRGLGKISGAAGGIIMSEDRKNAAIADQLKTYLNAGKGMEDFPLESLYTGAQSAIDRGDFKEANKLIAAMGTKHNRNIDPAKTNKIIHNYMSKFDKIGGKKFLDMLDHDISTNGGSDNNYVANFFGQNKEGYTHKWMQYNMRKLDAEQNARDIIGRESELNNSDFKVDNKISEFGNSGQSRVASARKFLGLIADPQVDNFVQDAHDKLEKAVGDNAKIGVIKAQADLMINSNDQQVKKAAVHFLSHINQTHNDLFNRIASDNPDLIKNLSGFNIKPEMIIKPRSRYNSTYAQEELHGYMDKVQHSLLDEIDKIDVNLTSEVGINQVLKAHSNTGEAKSQINNIIQNTKAHNNAEVKKLFDGVIHGNNIDIEALQNINVRTKLAQAGLGNREITDLENLKNKLLSTSRRITDINDRVDKINKQYGTI